MISKKSYKVKQFIFFYTFLSNRIKSIVGDYFYKHIIKKMRKQAPLEKFKRNEVTNCLSIDTFYFIF
jgi:hypothetical protein